jgi:hypothetical protein
MSANKRKLKIKRFTRNSVWIRCIKTRLIYPRTTSVFETYIKIYSLRYRNQTESNTASYPTCNPYNWLYKIQKMFRGILESIRLRGSALKNSIVVNETDFYTRAFVEIPAELFYSYTDVNSFTYGFNITSALSLLVKTSKIVNPYNPINPSLVINEMIFVYNCTNIFLKIC